MALLGRERKPTLGVVGPPLAVDVVAQRDLVGEQGGVAGLLEPPHAPVEVARVVLVVERPRRLRVPAPPSRQRTLIHDGAVARVSWRGRSCRSPPARATRSHTRAQATARLAVARTLQRRRSAPAPRTRAERAGSATSAGPSWTRASLEVGLADPQPPAGLVRGEVAALDRAVDRPLREPHAGRGLLDGQHAWRAKIGPQATVIRLLAACCRASTSWSREQDPVALQAMPSERRQGGHWRRPAVRWATRVPAPK